MCRDTHPPVTSAAPGARRLAWFHCFAGVAGDMALGALLDAGAALADVRAVLDRLALPGWRLTAEPVTRGGIGATRAVVTVAGDAGDRRYGDLVRIVEEAPLPPRVARRSLAVLRALAEAEASVHRVPLPDVHLHELGGHDTVVDVVGTAAALELLGVDEVAASPVAVGSGTIRSAHGLLPNPSPAVVALLSGRPVVGRPTPVELTTPTGAALVATWARHFGPVPAMSVTASGFGAGSADPDGMPNCLQVVIGEVAGAPEDPSGIDDSGSPEQVVLLETTVDDVTGEILGHAVTALLAAGALDAWVVPVVMKRGRPGHVLSALAPPETEVAVRRAVLSETGTLGVRVSRMERWVVPRRVDEVELAGHRLRVKVGPTSVKAEHVDAVRVAEALGRPARAVARQAEEAWRARAPGGSMPPHHQE